MRIVGTRRAEAGEGIVWDAVAGRLLWVDIRGRQVIETDPDAAEDEQGERAWPTGELACAVVPDATGGVVVALESRLVRLDRTTGRTEPLSAPPGHPASHRFNDAALDRQGRLVIGTMPKAGVRGEPGGTLYAYADRTWRTLDRGFRSINGLALSPDGGTLFLSDSHPSVRTIWCCSYDPATGDVGERRAFARIEGGAGRPDGATVDRDGGYWIAGVGGGQIHRFDRDGRLDRSIAVPFEKPSKVAFGGKSLDRMFVTSLAVQLDRPDPEGLAGALIEIDPQARGVPEVPFAG